MNENKMNNLLDLFSKENLSDEEKAKLNETLSTDSEAKELFDIYKKIETSVKSTVHLSPDDIANYIIFMKGLKSFNPAENSFLKKIDVHLNSCNSCNEEYKLLLEEYNYLDNHLTESIADETREVSVKKGLLSSIFTKQNSFAKYSFAFTVLLVFVYFSAFIISDFTTPDYIGSASIKSEREFYTTRSRGTDDFQKGLSAFDSDNFEKGINILEKDIRDNYKDETIFYSYYILGIAYLQSAEKDYLGLFKSYDNKKAENGIRNLKLSLAKNTSGNFDNVKFNSYYYLGKGYLMLDDITNAKKYLQKVVDNKGSKMNDATKLLNELR